MNETSEYIVSIEGIAIDGESHGEAAISALRLLHEWITGLIQGDDDSSPLYCEVQGPEGVPTMVVRVLHRPKTSVLAWEAVV